MADATLKDIRQRIQLLVQTYITDFKSTATNPGTVYDTAPMKLERAFLPAIVITDSITTYSGESRGRNEVKIITTFFISLYQGEWQANQDNNIDNSGLDATINELENLFIIRRGLENASNQSCVEDTFLQPSSPIEIKPYVPISGAVPSSELYVHKRMTINVRYSRKASM